MQIKNHLRIHKGKRTIKHKDEVFQCSKCPYSTKRKGNLKRHAQIYSSKKEKPKLTCHFAVKSLTEKITFKRLSDFFESNAVVNRV